MTGFCGIIYRTYYMIITFWLIWMFYFFYIFLLNKLIITISTIINILKFCICSTTIRTLIYLNKFPLICNSWLNISSLFIKHYTIALSSKQKHINPPHFNIPILIYFKQKPQYKLRLPGMPIYLEVEEKHMHHNIWYDKKQKSLYSALLHQNVQIIEYFCSVYTKKKQANIPE